MAQEFGLDGLVLSEVDQTSDTDLIYLGYATPGLTATSEARYVIKRYKKSTGQFRWAAGSLTANQIWDNRTSLSYKQPGNTN